MLGRVATHATGGWKRIALVGAVGLAFLLVACVAQSGVSALEAEAQGIDKTLICPVCPGETIDQSQVALAQQMRQTVRELLAQGMSRGEIYSFFVERYGPNVLAAPPKEGLNLMAWIVPPVVVAVAGGMLALVLREMRRRRPQYEEEVAEEPELAPYLSRVDAELGRELGDLQPPRRDLSPGPDSQVS